jgi:hypothetical protein
MLGGIVMRDSVQSGVRQMDSSQLQKIPDILNARGSQIESKAFAQAVLDLNDSVSGKLKAVELLTKKEKFQIGR